MATILKPGEYQWRETPSGTGWALLRHDTAGDTQARLLRYSPATVVPAARLDHTVQWLVTRGEAWCGELVLGRGSYACWPRGHDRPPVRPGPEGYAVLSVVSGATAPAGLPELAIPDPDALPWEAWGDGWGEGERSEGAATAISVRRLNGDPASGARVELWRLEPGRPLVLGPAPTLQELYVLRGNLRWEGERLPVTTYLAFDPGDDRGALEADEREALVFAHRYPR